MNILRFFGLFFALVILAGCTGSGHVSVVRQSGPLLLTQHGWQHRDTMTFHGNASLKEVSGFVMAGAQARCVNCTGGTWHQGQIAHMAPQRFGYVVAIINQSKQALNVGVGGQGLQRAEKGAMVFVNVPKREFHFYSYLESGAAFKDKYFNIPQGISKIPIPGNIAVDYRVIVTP